MMINIDIIHVKQPWQKPLMGCVEQCIRLYRSASSHHLYNRIIATIMQVLFATDVKVPWGIMFLCI